jgi:uncharacterized protein (DUF1330 family)
MTMKARYAVLAAAVAGFAAGTVTIEQLHAQAKPSVYYIGEIDMKDPEGYQKEYAPKAQATIKQYGGRLLAAGSNVKSFEGAPPKSRVAIQQWDSMEKIEAWRNSPEYKEARKIGDKYATFRAFAIVGMPQP